MDAAKTKSVLVTGGRGFIGRALLKLLRHAGREVISLDQSEPSPGVNHEAARELLCDISDAAELGRVFEAEQVEGIIHLAAMLPTAAQRGPLRATQVNVDGSLHLLELAQRFGMRRFVFGSSLSVYGTCPADQIVSESDRAAPEDLYGAGKLYVEQLGGAQGDDLEFVSLRIGRVIGPGAQSATSAWRSQIFELLGTRQAAEITLPYAGSERILLVHVDDVAKMLVALLDAPRLEHRVYNAPCQSMTVADLKHEVEALNPNLMVRLGDKYAEGNPRRLDSTRFQREFGFPIASIADQLQNSTAKMKS